jgi:hypothetical protein
VTDDEILWILDVRKAQTGSYRITEKRGKIPVWTLTAYDKRYRMVNSTNNLVPVKLQDEGDEIRTFNWPIKQRI